MEEKDELMKENSGKIGVGAVIGIVAAVIFGLLFLLVGIPLIIIVIVSAVSEVDTSNTLAQNTAIIDSIISQSSTSGLYDSMTADEELLYNNLNNERKILNYEVNTYEKYKDNKDKVKSFYDKTLTSSEKFGVTLREYALKYAKAIVDSNKDKDEMYDDIEKIYDEIYDEMTTDFYDDVYKGVLNDMYDFYYDDMFSEPTIDSGDLSQYINDKSQEYKWYTDTRSNVYTVYTKTRSDIYSFYSTIRSDIATGNTVKLEQDIKAFEEDVNKLKGNKNDTTTNSKNANSIDGTITTDNNTSILPSGGVSEDFKNAMDTYERFVNDYVEFIKKYKNNPTDLSMIQEYATMLQKYTEAESAFGEWKPENLTKEEVEYYKQVEKRVTEKMSNISEN